MAGWTNGVKLSSLAMLFVAIGPLTVHLGACEESNNLMSLYDYYVGENITSGLVADGDTFLLNGRPIRILSATIHYFRVHPSLWRDRLRKARAAGLNAIDTYVPWNLHEPIEGSFDFGDGSSEWSPFLNLRKFIKMVKEEDLFLILRPGPYICAEWDFGGMPSWLLRDPNLVVRSTYSNFLSRALLYIRRVASIARHYQFSNKYGAQPIIMVQVENEFGSLGVKRKSYLEALHVGMSLAGFAESLLFTADSVYYTGDLGAIDGVFRTVNTKSGYINEFYALDQVQPNKPKMVTEFWTGWFDSFIIPYHNHDSVTNFMASVKGILERGASIGLYMFHGGTNFGFMNGALHTERGYQPHATSYDYGAPLSEDGNYTENYWALKDYIMKNYALEGVRYPLIPLHPPAIAYPSCHMSEYLTLDDLIKRSVSIHINTLTGNFIENLNFTENTGQSYGFTAYTLTNQLNVAKSSVLKIENDIRDIAYVLVNDLMLTSHPKDTNDLNIAGYWKLRNPKFDLNNFSKRPASLRILTENMGRVNFGGPKDYLQNKGLGAGEVLLDSIPLRSWDITPLEFKSSWLKSLKGWRKVNGEVKGPALLRGSFMGMKGKDTFINMRLEGSKEWIKGQVFVNGFNMGRYWNIGPTKTLYIPGPFINDGENELMVFEIYKPGQRVHFSNIPDLG